MDKRTFARIFFAVWVFVWLLFLVRPYFTKDAGREYLTLLSLSPDEKRAYVTGRDLYEFIRFCNDSMRPNSSYQIMGLEKDPLSYRRARYYLYPNLESPDPEFLLIYKISRASRDGYRLFKSLDAEKYILMRAKR